jgi:predicted transcriptional regulator
MFLLNATKMSYQQLIVRQVLSGEPVSRLMVRNPVTVSPDLIVSELVDDYFYKYHFKMFPVANGDDLKGCITTSEVKAVPRDQWEKKTVGDIASPPTPENTIGPDTDALKALSMMNKTGSSRLMVADGRKLVGVITLKDLMRFLSVRMDLDKE